HVLAAVDELQVAVGIDGRDVAGSEPTIGVEAATARLLVRVVTADDPGTAHIELAARLAIVRLKLSLGIDELHLDAIERPPLHRLPRELLVLGAALELRLQRPERSHGAQLRHAPALKRGNAVFLLEALDHRRRRGRAADQDALD